MIITMIHEKSWGFEHWFVNNEKYCGKLLYVRKDEWSSKGKYHYHKIKDETFFVIDGVLLLDFTDEDDRPLHSIELDQYESFNVPPGMKHRFTSMSPEGCKFIEASTTHDEEDSYRCMFNHETQKWVEVVYGKG